MIDLLTLRIVAAVAIDLLLGDPRWLPHPVRLMGLAAKGLEAAFTTVLGRTYLSGILFSIVIVGGTAWGSWALLRFATGIDPRMGTALTIYFLFTSFAARDLDRHATRVRRTLEAGDLVSARRDLSMIVGRDTLALDRGEIIRGAVESVAESTLDGVIAPLFFAFVGGAPGALGFKAASTLDSMVGHPSDRYRLFGWASARLDDALNWIPARIAQLLYPAASLIVGLRPGSTWTAARTDGQKSPSPNAGISEAALAGALGVQLGGTNSYDGIPEERPAIGQALRGLEVADIQRSIAWMYASALLALLLFAGTRMAVVQVLLPRLAP